MNFRTKDNLYVTFSNAPQQINCLIEAMCYFILKYRKDTAFGHALSLESWI